MSLERTFQGPMKWVPSPSPNGHDPRDNSAVPASPTPSYTTAASTSAPSTPASHSDHRSALHLAPYYQGTLANGSASSSPSPSWSSPLVRPSYYQHPQFAASPGGASVASSAITNRSGYEGDHEADAASIQVSRPSSISSSSSSSSHRETGGEQLRNSNSVGVIETDTVTTSRAMQLLEEAVEQQASLVVAPRGTKGRQQCASQLKALNLFDAQYSAEADADPVPHEAGAAVLGLDAYKSDLDKIRQRGAGMRALNLLNDTAAGEKHKTPHEEKAQQGGAIGFGGGGAAALTARRAAQLAYERKQKEKEKVRAQLKQDLEMYGRRVPKLAVPVRNEAMAETSRKKKPATDEDVRDPETISGMKCKLYWDREKEATLRALKLLNDESAVMITML